MGLLTKRHDQPAFRSFFSDLFNDDLFGVDLFNDKNVPAVNVKEKEDSFEIEVSAPGYEKQDFDVSVDDGVLTISSEKDTESSEEKENFMRREFRSSSFKRSFPLPDSVKEDDIEGKYEHGILRVILKKKEEERKKGASCKKIHVS